MLACGKASKTGAPAAHASASAHAAHELSAPKGTRFIDDDVARARSLAAAGHKALFVDAWAQWCHTCTSMRGFVLRDPALDRYADRVVFAAVDTDREANADFLTRYAVAVWPSFFVIDPEGGKVLGYWPGSASLSELTGFVDQALDALRRLHSSKLDPAAPQARLLDAKAAEIAHDWARADRLYAEAVSGLGEGSSDWSEAIHGRLRALGALGSVSECVDAGLVNLGRITGVARPVDYTSTLMACVDRLRDARRKSEALTAITAHLRHYADTPPHAAAVDDRSEALGLLADALSAQGRSADAHAVLEERLGLLEKAAAAAPTPALAQAFDDARVSSLVTLGRGDQAVALLTRREAELPDAYDPPGRLAWVLTQLGRKREAVAALDRAIALGYGRRRVTYLDRKAQLEHDLGDFAAEASVLRTLSNSIVALGARLEDAEALAIIQSRLAVAEGHASRRQ